MKISESYIENKTAELRIVDAKYLGNFIIEVHFSDDKINCVDFKQFIENSLLPEVKKYKSEKEFSKYELKNGNLNWNDFEMIFPLSDLHDKTIISV